MWQNVKCAVCCWRGRVHVDDHICPECGDKGTLRVCGEDEDDE